jgi:glutamyl-tRNA synthetase
MRMEDLDPDRSRPEYATAALEDLRWLGMDWQEGPDVGGPFAPYEQSLRHQIYLAAWEKLQQGGFIYPCRCSRKDLAAALSAPHEGKQRDADPLDDEPVYPGTCRPPAIIPTELPGSPTGWNWRFRVHDREAIEFEDLNLGRQRFVAGLDFGDFVIWRRDRPASPRTHGVPSEPGLLAGVRTDPRPWGSGVPSYQLACVADDATMQITEVVRGADLLKSTARQILLNRALGFRDPVWYHCGLIVDNNGRRLAKRHDDLSIGTLRNRGLSPAEVLAGDLNLYI